MAIQLFIQESDLSIISKRRRTEQSSKFQRRYQCLWILHEGYLRKDVAHMLGVNIDTITDWIKIYNNSGLTGLGLLHYKGMRVSSLDAYKQDILSLIKDNRLSTINDLCIELEQTHGIVVEHSWLYRYCKKKSIALIKKHD